MVLICEEAFDTAFLPKGLRRSPYVIAECMSQSVSLLLSMSLLPNYEHLSPCRSLSCVTPCLQLETFQMPSVKEEPVFLNEPGPPAMCSMAGAMMTDAQINSEKATGNSF